jgi:hypothetical protein
MAFHKECRVELNKYAHFSEEIEAKKGKEQDRKNVMNGRKRQTNAERNKRTYHFHMF